MALFSGFQVTALFGCDRTRKGHVLASVWENRQIADYEELDPPERTVLLSCVCVCITAEEECQDAETHRTVKLNI